MPNDPEAPSTPAAAARSHPEVALVLDSIAYAVITTDPNFHITSWNPGAAALYGWSEEEVLGRRMGDLVPILWVDAAAREESIRTLRSEGIWRGDLVQVRRDQQRIQVYAVVSLIRDEAGNPVGTVAVNRDTTALRQAESAVAQLEARLDEVQNEDPLGQFATTVAHDFGNLLAVIGIDAELAALALPPGHPAGASLTRIQECVRQAAALAGQLVSYSRRDQLDATTFDAVAWLEESQPALRSALGPGHQLLLQVPERPVWLRVGAADLELALSNLCANARDAMPRPGTVTISLVEDDADRATITVTDTGEGMTPAVRAGAFEPFFTTRKPLSRHGLGLTVVQRAARRYGGTVELVSQRGVGTTVKLHLPTVEPPTRARPVRPPASRTLRVLLAEDYDSVREVLAGLVGSMGHEVIEARDGQEAVDLAAREPFDLLLTDVSMPRLNGPATAARLRAERMDLPVVYLSGFPLAEFGNETAVWPEGVFRQKPIRREELALAFTEALTWSKQQSAVVSLPPPD